VEFGKIIFDIGAVEEGKIIKGAEGGYDRVGMTVGGLG
jgi:hypothetical protein